MIGMPMRVFVGLAVAALLLAFVGAFGLVTTQNAHPVSSQLQNYGSR